MDNKGDLKQRTRAFGLAVLRLEGKLPSNQANRVLLGQIMRSATSVGSNYRAAQRAQSVADMISKFKRVEEEADESDYWLDLLIELNPEKTAVLYPLRKECNELTAMVVASIRTLRKKANQPKAKEEEES